MTDAQRRWFFAHLQAGKLAATEPHHDVLPAAEATAQTVVPKVPAPGAKVPPSSLWAARLAPLGRAASVVGQGAKRHVKEHAAGMALTAAGVAAAAGSTALARAHVQRFLRLSNAVKMTPGRVAREGAALGVGYWGGVVPAQNLARKRWDALRSQGKGAQAQQEREAAVGLAGIGAGALLAHRYYGAFKLLRKVGTPA